MLLTPPSPHPPSPLFSFISYSSKEFFFERSFSLVMNEFEVDDICDIVTSICSGEEVYQRIRQQCRFLYDSIREGNTPMFFVPRRSIDNILLRTIPNTGLEVLTVANRNKTSTRSFNCRRNIQSVTQILIILSTAGAFACFEMFIIYSERRVF
jgi:hypothetical protein